MTLREVASSGTLKVSVCRASAMTRQDLALGLSRMGRRNPPLATLEGTGATCVGVGMAKKDSRSPYLDGDVCVVPLTKGKFSVTSPEFLPVVSRYLWQFMNVGYAGAHDRAKRFYMHRMIVQLAHGDIPHRMYVDHINRDKLDNRVENLRIVSSRDNGRNKSLLQGRRFRGVYWEASRNKWAARAKRDGVFRLIGRFDSEVSAAIAYNEFVVNASGLYILNDIPPEPK